VSPTSIVLLEFALPSAVGVELKLQSIVIVLAVCATIFIESIKNKIKGNHNVVSNGGATESFDSGVLQGAGFTFSHTFISEGTNDYVCTPHSGNMFGTITVVAEGALSISEAQRLKFETFPNPASNNVSIQLPSGTEKATVHFYDSLGRLALSKKVTSMKNTIDVSSISSGVYILKVVTEDKIGSQKFMKN